MNTERSITYRLLDKFPLNYLKREFDSRTTRKDRLINELLESNSIEELSNFTIDHFGILKQHVYIFELNNELVNNWNFDLLNVERIYQEEDKKVFSISFTSETSIYNYETGSAEIIKFKVPVKISVKNTKFIVSINIQESKVSKYFNGKVSFLKKLTTDKHFIEQIKEALPNGTTFVPCDINAGVKRIWEDWVIDAALSTFKNANSTTIETMDENSLLRATDPDLYNEIKLKPLNRSYFKILDNQSLLPNFVVQPMKGIVSFNNYPNNANGINELLNLIINSN